MPTSPKTHTRVMTGTGEETIDISPQYMHNVITILGLAEGTVTTRAMEHSNNALEDVINGAINLKYDRTIIVEDVQIKQFGFTLSPAGTAYTVKVKQYNPMAER